MASRAYQTANELQPGDQRLLEKLVEVETINQREYELSNSQKPYGIHLLKARNALEYGLDNRDELVEKAILKLEAFLDSEKDDPDALLKLSGLLKETGDTRGAIECYKRVLEVDPENQRAVRFLVYAYSEMGREDDAFRMHGKESPEIDGFHPRVRARARWPQVAETAGHKTHFFDEGVMPDCIDCHGDRVHIFEPPEERCVECHGEEMTLASETAEVHCITCHEFLTTMHGLFPRREDCLEGHDVEPVRARHELDSSCLTRNPQPVGANHTRHKIS